MNTAPTSQSWLNPVERREVGTAANVIGGVGVSRDRTEMVRVGVPGAGYGSACVTVAVGDGVMYTVVVVVGIGERVGDIGTIVGEGIGDTGVAVGGSVGGTGVGAGELVGEGVIVWEGIGVGGRVTVGVFVAVVVLVGAVISGVASVVMGGLVMVGVPVRVATAIEVRGSSVEEGW